jgi:hypothetical protein
MACGPSEILDHTQDELGWVKRAAGSEPLP